MGKRYEYKLLSATSQSDLLTMDDLARSGEEGWEIASIERNTAIVQFDDPHAVRFGHILLKREIHQDDQARGNADGKDTGGKRAQ